MKKIEKWVAEDGTEFLDRDACGDHEAGVEAEAAFLAAHSAPDHVSTTELFQWIASQYNLIPKVPAYKKG